VSVVEQPIAKGVGDGGIAEVVVPLRDGDLADDDRGAMAMAVFDDLEQIPALAVGERSEPPVVEDEDVAGRGVSSRG
jgi:hypothetical protein